jgi:isopentenyldiphosphate isomerase
MTGKQMLMAPIRTSPKNRAIAAIVILVALMFLVTTKRHTEHQELLTVYDFAEGVTEPTHLTPLDVAKDLVARDKLYSIDDAHRQGLIHCGTWIWISDSEGKVLVLKRGPHLVTCPNSYSLLGEHTLGLEKPEETVRRGIKEELGAAMLRHIKAVELLPASPLYYFRDYGTQNSNRIDRQLTYLWWVEMDRPGAQLPLKLDAEVAHHDWIATETLQSWFKEAHNNLLNTGYSGSRICHETIVTLWEKVFKEVQRIQATKTTI